MTRRKEIFREMDKINAWFAEQKAKGVEIPNELRDRAYAKYSALEAEPAQRE
jgi:hypothetical protein